MNGAHVDSKRLVDAVRVPTGSPPGSKPPLVTEHALHAPGFFRP